MCMCILAFICIHLLVMIGVYGEDDIVAVFEYLKLWHPVPEVIQQKWPICLLLAVSIIGRVGVCKKKKKKKYFNLVVVKEFLVPHLKSQTETLEKKKKKVPQKLSNFIHIQIQCF